MTPYSGNSAVFPTTISLIDDSDAPTASNFDAAPQALADRTAWLQASSLFHTGGTVSGTIELTSGAILQVDVGATINLFGLEQIESGGQLSVLNGSQVSVQAGGLLVVNPVGTLSINGTLAFSTGSILSGTASSGTLHFAGNTISLDAAAGIVANAPNAIEIVSAQGLAVESGGSVAWLSGSVANFVSGSSIELFAGSVLSVSGLIDVIVPAGLRVESGASADLEAGGTLNVNSGGQIVLVTGSQEVLGAGVPVRRNAGASTQPLTVAVGDVTDFVFTTTTTASPARFTFTVPIGHSMSVDMFVATKNPDSGVLIANSMHVLCGAYNNGGTVTNVVADIVASVPLLVPGDITLNTSFFLGTFTVIINYAYAGGATLTWVADCRAVVL